MKGFQELVYTIVGLVFLLLGLVLLSQITIAAEPFDQITLANTEKLASAINEACLKGDITQDSPIRISLDFPQTVPVQTNLLGAENIPFFPGFAINLRGDPEYLLYYETFPAGEAAGWEVYHDLQTRIVAPVLNDDATKIPERIQQLRNSSDSLEEVVISNVVFHKNFDAVSGQEIEGDDIYGIGEYRTSGEYSKGTKSVYDFINYYGSSQVNKTLFKYESCGDNALCLKTDKNVRSFPLTQCSNAGIDYIQLVHTERVEVTAPMAQSQPDPFDSTHHTSDFYLASPCSIEKGYVNIYVTDCSDSCQSFEKYDIYKYAKDSSKLVREGQHYTCTDRMKKDETITQTSTTGDSPQRCVVVEIRKVNEGFCYTSNKNSVNNGHPVSLSSEYDPELKAFILSPTSVLKDHAKTILIEISKGEFNFIDLFAKPFAKLGWLWPG